MKFLLTNQYSLNNIILQIKEFACGLLLALSIPGNCYSQVKFNRTFIVDIFERNMKLIIQIPALMKQKHYQ